MNKYSVGIIGLGSIGNWHRQFINNGTDFHGKFFKTGIKNLKVTGSFDIAEDKQKLALEHGLTAYTSLKELLTDPKIDIVIVATPNDLHKSLVIKALEAGKHVVCEKPAAMNPAEFQKMIDASKNVGKVFAVHQNRRWDEDYLTVKKLYEEKTLGELFRIESKVHSRYGMMRSWRSEPQHGGGLLVDWGVHILDQALQMTTCKLTKVYARLTHITNETVDDGFYAELTFENGLVFLAEACSNNFIGMPRWYVLGEDGSAVIDDFRGDGRMVRFKNVKAEDRLPVKTLSGKKRTVASRFGKPPSNEVLKTVKSNLHEFFQNFMAVIEGREQLAVPLDSVMRTMKLMEAIKLSSKKGMPVKFE